MIVKDSIHTFITNEISHKQGSLLAIIDRYKNDNITEVFQSKINIEGSFNLENSKDLSSHFYLLDTKKFEEMLNQANVLEEEINKCRLNDFETNLKVCVKIHELNEILQKIQKEQIRLEKIINQLAPISDIKQKKTLMQMDEAPALEIFFKETQNYNHNDVIKFLKSSPCYENILFELAKFDMAKDCWATCRYFGQYEINDEAKCFEIAKIAATKDASATSEYFQKFGIKNEDKCFEIAKIAATENGKATSKYIQRYGIKDINILFEILEITLKGNPKTTTTDIAGYVAASRLTIPAEFDTEKEESNCQKEIENLLNNLLNLAEVKLGISKNQLNWVKEDVLKGINSLQQREKLASWLNELLVRSMVAPACMQMLKDENSKQALIAIGKMPDPHLQRNSTEVLLSLYRIENEERKKVLASFDSQKLPSHLLLPALFLTYSGLNEKLRFELLKPLKAKYYQNLAILNPIVEMTDLISRDPSMSSQERVEILSHLLEEPQPNQREKFQSFQSRLAVYRENQIKWIKSARDLLFFHQGGKLKNIQNPNEVLDLYKSFCKDMFGVKCTEDELEQLFTLFNDSQRLPGALFSYAARLQILPEEEKELLIEKLGLFVTAVMNQKFPAIRYENNEHLTKIFEGNSALLDKWKEPIVKKIEDQKVETSKEEKPYQLVQKLMKTAFEERHLGKDQEQQFPTLFQLKENWGDSHKLQELKGGLIEESKALAAQIKEETNPQQKIVLQQKKSFLDIEQRCLKLLDVDLDVTTLKQHLNALLKLLPDHIIFKNDIKGILDQLSLIKETKNKWIVQDTDAWEDMLLIGSEVAHSCQKVDGDPYDNKCLLAYILDGKNRAVVVRDPAGKIAARAVLRILWDDIEKKPVLFMEKLYTRTPRDPMFGQMIQECCIAKAKNMGLPLVASSKDYRELKQIPTYPHDIEALGGPAPFEYVDALGEIAKNGKFTISSSHLLFQP